MPMQRRLAVASVLAATRTAADPAAIALSQRGSGNCAGPGSDHMLLQAHSFSLAPAASTAGEPHIYRERVLVADEGDGVGEKFDVGSAAECAALCDATDACRSFSYSAIQKACHLKDREVTDDDPAQAPGKWHYSTYMRGEPHDSSTVIPATPPSTDDKRAEVEARVYVVRSLVADEGHEIFVKLEATLDDCKAICDRTRGCQSFAFSSMQRSCHFKDKLVTEGDQAAEPYLDFQTYMAINGEASTLKNEHDGADIYMRGSVQDCVEEIDGGKWTLVRHTKGSGAWGPWNDNLAGVAEHGEPADSLAPHDWTVPWTVAPKEFLFSFADCSHWLIAEPAQVNGENFANQPRWILKSSEQAEPYQAKWYNRAGNREDPWVSERDHWLSGKYGSGAMLYGEAGRAGHLAMKNAHGGANVYIRSASP